MLLAQDDLGDLVDVGVGDLAVAVDVGIILLELRRGLALRLKQSEGQFFDCNVLITVQQSSLVSCREKMHAIPCG